MIVTTRPAHRLQVFPAGRLFDHKKDDKTALVAPEVLGSSHAKPEFRKESHLGMGRISRTENCWKYNRELTMPSLFTSRQVLLETSSVCIATISTLLNVVTENYIIAPSAVRFPAVDEQSLDAVDQDVQQWSSHRTRPCILRENHMRYLSVPIISAYT